jgi:hypothetical protein
MDDFKKIATEISEREMSRGQFLGAVGGSFLGVIGVLNVIQALNTPEPNLANGNKDVFGEREYGHTGGPDASSPKKFDEGSFG